MNEIRGRHINVGQIDGVSLWIWKGWQH